MSIGSGTGVSPVNRHGQDGPATANDTTTEEQMGVTNRPYRDILNVRRSDDVFGIGRD